MKHFIKVFFISLLCFMLMIGAGIYTYARFFNPDESIDYTQVENPAWYRDFEEVDEETLTPLEMAIRYSKRVNVLVLGLEGTRSDTIMLVSFDRATAHADIISIPRDTFFHREGYDNPGQKKINAVYGASGATGTMRVLENLLKIPVHNFVTVDFEAVKKTVDVLNGVEVEVPFDMDYEDPYATPPLKIDIKKGVQILDGDQALQYLRFRHNNDLTVGYPDGDLGRIKAQQTFIKNAARKAMSFRLPAVIREIYPYFRTDLTLADMLLLAGDAITFSTEKMTTQTLPGHATMIEGVSYFVHDPKQVVELVESIYGVE